MVEHFNHDEGFEQPLLDGVLRGSTHVTRRLFKLCSAEASYLVYIATNTTRDRGARLERRRVGDNAWEGDMVILRRSMNKPCFVNFRRGDRGRAASIIVQ